MRPAETTARLAQIGPRSAGSDAERRAASELVRALARPETETSLETFWCRPNWALAHTWHVALAIAGSLLSVGSPQAGGALLLIALLSVVADEETGVSLGRRLTPERASQNVVMGRAERNPVRLIITAPYASDRRGLIHRLHPPRLRLPLGWLAWLALAMIWLLAVAVLRASGAKGTGIGIVQFPPTVFLVLALAALLDIATATPDSGAANATATAAAIALAQALTAAPPTRLEPRLVLQGANEIGLRRHLRGHRHSLKASNTVVLGIAPCGQGDTRWWISDGPLVPLRYLPALSEICARMAESEPELGARSRRGRGVSPALRARAARLPAISIGADPPGDSRAQEKTAIDRTVEFGLMLADEIDAYVARRRQRPGRL